MSDITVIMPLQTGSHANHSEETAFLNENGLSVAIDSVCKGILKNDNEFNSKCFDIHTFAQELMRTETSEEYRDRTVTLYFHYDHNNRLVAGHSDEYTNTKVTLQETPEGRCTLTQYIDDNKKVITELDESFQHFCARMKCFLFSPTVMTDQKGGVEDVHSALITSLLPLPGHPLITFGVNDCPLHNSITSQPLTPIELIQPGEPETSTVADNRYYTIPSGNVGVNISPDENINQGISHLSDMLLPEEYCGEQSLRNFYPGGNEVFGAAFINNTEGNVVGEVWAAKTNLPYSSQDTIDFISGVQEYANTSGKTVFCPLGITERGPVRTPHMVLLRCIPGEKSTIIDSGNGACLPRSNNIIIQPTGEQSLMDTKSCWLRTVRQIQWQVSQLCEGIKPDDISTLTPPHTDMMDAVSAIDFNRPDDCWADMDLVDKLNLLKADTDRINQDIYSSRDKIGQRIVNGVLGLVNIALGVFVSFFTAGAFSWVGVPAMAAGVNQLISSFTGRGLMSYLGGKIGDKKGEKAGRIIDSISNIGLSMAIGWFFSYTSAMIRTVFHWTQGRPFNTTEMVNSGVTCTAFFIAQNIKDVPPKGEYEFSEAKKLLKAWGDTNVSAEQFKDKFQNGYIPLLKDKNVIRVNQNSEIEILKSNGKILTSLPDSERHLIYSDNKSFKLKLSDYLLILQGDQDAILRVSTRLGVSSDNRRMMTGFEAGSLAGDKLRKLGLFDTTAAASLCCASASYNFCEAREALMLKAFNSGGHSPVKLNSHDGNMRTFQLSDNGAATFTGEFHLENTELTDTEALTYDQVKSLINSHPCHSGGEEADFINPDNLVYDFFKNQKASVEELIDFPQNIKYTDKAVFNAVSNTYEMTGYPSGKADGRKVKFTLSPESNGYQLNIEITARFLIPATDDFSSIDNTFSAPVMFNNTQQWMAPVLAAEKEVATLNDCDIKTEWFLWFITRDHPSQRTQAIRTETLKRVADRADNNTRTVIMDAIDLWKRNVQRQVSMPA